jgi:hypothetical protein
VGEREGGREERGVPNVVHNCPLGGGQRGLGYVDVPFEKVHSTSIPDLIRGEGGGSGERKGQRPPAIHCIGSHRRGSDVE